MTPTEYAAKLRHAADVIERLGVVPMYAISWSFFALAVNDFKRAFAGKEAERNPSSIGFEWTGVIDGIKFCCDERVPLNAETVTLPAEAA